MVNLLTTIKKYYLFWLHSSLMSFYAVLENRFGALLFVTGKFLRFYLFLFFLEFIFAHTNSIQGYSLNELKFFYLNYNFIDSFGQFFYRGIYWFRQQVISGEFDAKLIKPLNPLFQVLTSKTDILDLPLLVLTAILIIHSISSISPQNLLFYTIFIFFSICLTTCIHIIVAAIGLLTSQVDHTMMIYRDISTMARFPMEIYGHFIKGFFTYIIPIVVIFSFPSEFVLGRVPIQTIFTCLVITVISSLITYRFWLFSLTHYSSASS